MKLYHGSESIIYHPIYGAGRTTNDYGRGFYCTEDLDLAKEWACKKGRDGYACCYELSTENLSICDLNSGEYHILNWLALLTQYRGYWQRKSIAEEAKNFLQANYAVDISSFDLIRGYRADDSYFSFAQDFIMGTISLRKLSEAMRLGALNEQIVLKSERAFAQLRYVSYESAQAVIYYQKKVCRDEEARRGYQKLGASADRLQDLYILDIMRGKVNEDELRI